uniref:Uncharacterized protein n=1 Tax=Moniliophthora roreri TaxID=221103 RepID=A0A0W0FW68_MONRR
MDREMSHEEIHIWSWALVVIIGDQEGVNYRGLSTSASLPHTRHRVKAVALTGNVHRSSSSTLTATLVVNAFSLFDKLESVTLKVVGWASTQKNDQSTKRTFPLIIEILNGFYNTGAFLSKLSSKKLVELVIQTRSFYGPVGFDLLPGIVWNFISTLTNLRSLSVGPFHRTSDGEQIFAVRSRLEHSQELCLSYNFGEGIHPTTDPSNFYPHSHPSEPSSHSPSDKHASRLRSLDLRAAFVKKRSLRLLEKCHRLEELEVATSPRRRIDGHRTISDQKRPTKTLSNDEAAEILRTVPGLRRLIVDDAEWLGSWVLDAEGAMICVMEDSDEIWTYIDYELHQ